MTHYFPAAPGTLIATRDHEATHGVLYTPVVGWCHVQGNLAFPIAAMNFGGLTHGKAVVDPGGFVTDATHMQVFENVEEWVRFIDLAKAPPEKTAEGADLAEELDMDSTPRKLVSEDTFTVDVEPLPGVTQAIKFGTKSYKSKSFWKAPYLEAIFEIEGGANYPEDPRVEKTTRDEFNALKKAGWDVTDPHTGVLEDAPAADEDDDGMDLV